MTKIYGPKHLKTATLVFFDSQTRSRSSVTAENDANRQSMEPSKQTLLSHKCYVMWEEHFICSS